MTSARLGVPWPVGDDERTRFRASEDHFLAGTTIVTIQTRTGDRFRSFLNGNVSLRDPQFRVYFTTFFAGCTQRGFTTTGSGWMSWALWEMLGFKQVLGLYPDYLKERRDALAEACPAFAPAVDLVVGAVEAAALSPAVVDAGWENEAMKLFAEAMLAAPHGRVVLNGLHGTVGAEESAGHFQAAPARWLAPEEVPETKAFTPTRVRYDKRGRPIGREDW